MSLFTLNMKKVSQDFGSLRKMADKLNIKKSTIDHILYNRKTLSFRKDSVREVVNELISKGYLLYADEVGEEARAQTNQKACALGGNSPSSQVKDVGACVNCGGGMR
ncbi:hypothetical protein V3I05_07790 [Helicobacter mastomyrinus]|uniref:Transcriptional regulator n=1 Tax=Helicobacter mastomyrinus TaxID=287948 RepID=A0ABZ3F375_9HELI